MTEHATARARASSPAAVAVAAGLVAVVVVVLRLQTFDWEPTGFVWASDIVVDEDAAPPNLLVRSDISGFDGTGFYRFALDPFTRERTDFGIILDHPAFRHQRILYPLLAWTVTGGDPVGVAWALIAINIAGLALIGWLGASLAASAGRARPWGLMFAFNPAFALALGVDTAEIVAGAGLLAALLALRRRAWGWATAALVTGMFARETVLLLAAGGVLAHVVRRRAPDRPPLWVFVAPAVVYVAWQGFLLWWWNGLALASGAGLDIGPPFLGIAEGIGEWTPIRAALDVLHLVLLAAIVGLAWMGLRAAARGAGLAHERAALVLSTVLISITAGTIWFHHWGFLRATSELYSLAALAVLAEEHAPRHRLALAPAICVSIWLNMLLYP